MSEKHTALITGASRGIGRALALQLAQDPKYTDLILIYRKSTGAMSLLMDEISSISPTLQTISYQGDVGDIEFVEFVKADLKKNKLEPDLIVNNAAVSHVGLLTDMTPQEWQESISVNLTSLYNVCHTFVPGMVAKQAGRIINVSSVWGLVGASCEVAYSATKGAVNAFTKALAKELAPSNISCNAIAFGIVDTEMNGHLTTEEINAVIDEVPASRMLSAAEAAETIVRMSEMPLYVTGDVLKCDGGWI